MESNHLHVGQMIASDWRLVKRRVFSSPPAFSSANAFNRVTGGQREPYPYWIPVLRRAGVSLMEGTGRELPVQALYHGQERKVDRFRRGRTDALKFRSGEKVLLLISA